MTGQHRVLPVGDHPADRVAAEDVEHDVEVEVRPLRRPQQLGDVPGPGVVSAPWPPARVWRTGDAHVDCAARGPADSRPGSDTSSAPSTGSGRRRAALPRPPPAHGRRSVGRRAHRGPARARLHTAPGRALDGAAGARELTSDDGRRSPATRPALGRPAPHRPPPPTALRSAVGGTIETDKPGNFSLHVQNRVRGVQLVLQTSHLRLQRAHLRIQRVAFCRLPAALLRGQLPQRALAPGLAPSRQMRAVQLLAAKQPTHLAALRAALHFLYRRPRPTAATSKAYSLSRLLSPRQNVSMVKPATSALVSRSSAYSSWNSLSSCQ